MLGIRSEDGTFVGAPRPDTRILPAPSSCLYGHEDALAELRDRRRGRAGDAEHEEGRRRHERAQAEEHSRRSRSRRAEG